MVKPWGHDPLPTPSDRTDHGRSLSSVEPGATCPECDGVGTVYRDVDGTQRAFSCPRCHGTGRLEADGNSVEAEQQRY